MNQLSRTLSLEACGRRGDTEDRRQRYIYPDTDEPCTDPPSLASGGSPQPPTSDLQPPTFNLRPPPFLPPPLSLSLIRSECKSTWSSGRQVSCCHQRTDNVDLGRPCGSLSSVRIEVPDKPWQASGGLAVNTVAHSCADDRSEQ